MLMFTLTNKYEETRVYIRGVLFLKFKIRDTIGQLKFCNHILHNAMQQKIPFWVTN